MQINLGSRISFWNNLLEICCHKHKSCLLELQWHVNRQIMLLTATSVWLLYVVSHLKLGSLWFILTLNKFQSHCLTILSHVRSKSPEKYSLDVDDPSESDSLPGLQSDSDPDYLTENDGNHLTNCSRIYDLVRKLVLTKGQAKLQSSRLSYFSSQYTDIKLSLRYINPTELFDSHLEFSSDKLGEVGDEHGEHFHQDISVMESRHQGRWCD